MDAFSGLIRDALAKRAREALQAAQARRSPAAAPPAPRLAPPAPRLAPPAPSLTSPGPNTAVPPPEPRLSTSLTASVLESDALAPAELPTTILDVPPPAPSPLLAAFRTRDGLLAAIVLSEALAPPIGLR